MATKNNKYYSNRQEQMIANYLDWSQVVGSGSRPFTAGDVNSSHWVGECKTHDTEQSNVVFMKTHWLKLTEEAMAKKRFPVLFTDNGTQRADNTWVMTSLGIFDPTIVNIIDGLKNTSTKGNSLNFDLESTKALFKNNAKDDKLNAFTITWEGRKLAVTTLETFRDYIKENF